MKFPLFVCLILSVVTVSGCSRAIYNSKGITGGRDGILPMLSIPTVDLFGLCETGKARRGVMLSPIGRGARGTTLREFQVTSSSENAEQAEFCTYLGDLYSGRTKGYQRSDIVADPARANEFYQKGCKLGDEIACERKS